MEAKQEESMSQNRNLKIKLPPITIHLFSGKYEEWLAFRDLFVKAVHEQKISNSQKFHELKRIT